MRRLGSSSCAPHIGSPSLHIFLNALSILEPPKLCLLESCPLDCSDFHVSTKHRALKVLCSLAKSCPTRDATWSASGDPITSTHVVVTIVSLYL